MNVTIESARTNDFLAVAALDRIAWPIRPDEFIPDGEHVWRLWCEYATVLVARDLQGGLGDCRNVAGALLMFPGRRGEELLHKIMVHPDRRGRGIGSQLMKSALVDARTDVLLTVNPANAAAVKLYENFGFRIRERIDGFYRPHEHRYVMVYSPKR
jgi:phosphinothricin acetyltransferase